MGHKLLVFAAPWALLFALFVPALRGADLADAPEPAEPANVVAAAPALHEVVEKRDIAYYTGDDADPLKHQLDLYLPKGKQDFPVVMFVHGGAWVFGDKADFGLYAAIGRMLARHGIGAVLVNYRLSPQVQHPEHIKDVARAFAWTHRHIAEYGGRADRLFVCGHSAGGHLTALLATDESWLKAERLSLRDIRGAIPISGVYTIPRGAFQRVFGSDAKTRDAASPLSHAHAGCPPFLIIYGDHDFPTCDRASEAFCKALVAQGVTAETLVLPRNHIDIVVSLRHNDDACAKAVRAFVAALAQ